jgi:hypothetical protein
MVKPRIRFDLDLLPVSVIANQWYCEKAIDLHYRHPKIDFFSPELALGTAEHELLSSEAKLLTEPEMKKLIKSGKAISLREVPFEGTFRGVKIKGYPDYVEIEGGNVLLVLDYKFSKHRRVFPSQRIQVDTYGYLLHRNKLNTKNLICGIAIISPELSSQFDIREDITVQTYALVSEMRRKKLDKVNYPKSPELFGGLMWFSLSRAERNLNWAIDYWTSKRRPVPTTKAQKCGGCSFNSAGLCRFALVAAETY